jgi:hypothetical protein
MHSIDQIQKLKTLLQSLANVAPVYFTRTPKGKRLLQLPHIPKISPEVISNLEPTFGLLKPTLDNVS